MLLTNDFHNTQQFFYVKEGDIITWHWARSIKMAICGATNCPCGSDEFGRRGPQPDNGLLEFAPFHRLPGDEKKWKVIRDRYHSDISGKLTEVSSICPHCHRGITAEEYDRGKASLTTRRRWAGE